MDMGSEQLAILIVKENGPQGSSLLAVHDWTSHCGSRTLDSIPQVLSGCSYAVFLPELPSIG